jgi:hypothetical protein
VSKFLFSFLESEGCHILIFMYVGFKVSCKYSYIFTADGIQDSSVCVILEVEDKLLDPRCNDAFKRKRMAKRLAVSIAYLLEYL